MRRLLIGDSTLIFLHKQNIVDQVCKDHHYAVGARLTSHLVVVL